MRPLPVLVPALLLIGCTAPCETLSLDTMVPAIEACGLEAPAWMAQGPWDCDGDYDYDCGTACWEAASCEDIEVWLGDDPTGGTLYVCEEGCWAAEEG
ncbi:MAG: hypothetical protein ABIO70_33255 [Pseudomonadota bacterium]